MWENIIQVLMAGVGTLGFTLFFFCKQKNMWPQQLLEDFFLGQFILLSTTLQKVYF